MKKRNTFLIIPFIAIFPFIQGNYFGLNTYVDALNNNPYIIDSTDTFKMVENSEQLDGAAFELNVADTNNQAFYNDVLAYANDIDQEIDNEFSVEYDVNDGSNQTTYSIYPLLEQSDVENGKFRFFMDDISIGTSKEIEIEELIDFDLAVDSKYNDFSYNIPLDTSKNDGIYIPSDNRTFNTEDSSISSYPTIDDVLTDPNVFKIVNYDSTSVTFSLNIKNFTNPLNILEISLTDLNETNESYKTKPYQANLVSSDMVNEIYTYKIDGLTGDEYQFYSLNNSKISFEDDGTYNPQNNITFEEDLNFAQENLYFNTNEINPYVIENSFTMYSDTITTSSIQFSIEIVDTQDNKFYNKLVTDGNQIVVTFIKDGAHYTTLANWTGVAQPTDGIYYFEAFGLSKNADYEFYSLDNMGLAIGTETSSVDSQILIKEELGATETQFKTLDNSYIIYNGFQIIQDSISRKSVRFTITVENWTDPTLYQSDLNIKMKEINTTSKVEEETIYEAHYVSNDGDHYTYEIDNLKTETNYQMTSIVDPSFRAISSNAPTISEIPINAIDGSSNSEFLTKRDNNVIFYSIVAFLAILLIFSIFLIRILIQRRKREREMNEELNTGEFVRA